MNKSDRVVKLNTGREVYFLVLQNIPLFSTFTRLMTVFEPNPLQS
ncbi:hypothetical protein COO91_04132 [Nostoc flagelliforme CCNUN1]|uniref:Uncharacterized protein n=1 Tax=Nostoc flagelliforme CCNUN1 TaxID=2038116 RepID=A0A2K8SRX0_9NOSO|nr:hypothetical protein COO91_04132 [Nostoc flagelliforme CCNUN1]